MKAGHGSACNLGDQDRKNSKDNFLQVIIKVAI